jgi:hypothetical protein
MDESNSRAVYTKALRDEAVKLALTDSVGVLHSPPTVLNPDQDAGKPGAHSEAR